MLFNEPKLLKSNHTVGKCALSHVSVLFNEPKLLKSYTDPDAATEAHLVSVLFNEPKLLKFGARVDREWVMMPVSVLFNEPKLLKSLYSGRRSGVQYGFSALQRAEIAEILTLVRLDAYAPRFSALQRAEIAEILPDRRVGYSLLNVSVLFNEPKLLKSGYGFPPLRSPAPVSVLFNEPKLLKFVLDTQRSRKRGRFQCSSTSRNC